MNKPGTGEVALAAALCVAVALACKQGKSDDDAKAVAERAEKKEERNADDDGAKQKETPPAPANPALAAADQAKFEVRSTLPAIPKTRSNPPVGKEWNDAVPVNTQGANARGKNCRMLLLREWLNIHCNGDIIGYEKKEDFGTLHEDYYEQVVPGKLASFVIRLRPGHHPKIRVCRQQNRASLFVNWPPARDFPTHVALGHGPPCDGSDWGVGYGTKGGAAVKPQPGSVPPSEKAAYEAMDAEILGEAKKSCARGVADACNYVCGKSTCP